MATKKVRDEVPEELADKVLFYSSRTCCICRERDKPIQIHHIDENPSNNDFKNLAVLCFDCHHKTQLRGGFDRKLNARQVTLFRDEWLAIVSKRSSMSSNTLQKLASPRSAPDVEIATSVTEIFRDREEYQLLAIYYIAIGNKELRDKYIELAIQKGVSDETFLTFRRSQGRMNEIPSDLKDRIVKKLENKGDWTALGEFYYECGDTVLYTKFMCRALINKIEEGNIYSASLMLKYMIGRKTLDNLFAIAFEKAHKEGNLRRELRILLELNRHKDAFAFLLEHKSEIESSKDLFMSLFLASALGDDRGIVEANKMFWKSWHEGIMVDEEKAIVDNKMTTVKKGDFYDF